jgi:hypothetical protein
MDIAVLTFEGCPNAQPTAQLVQQTVRELGIEAEVKKISVHDQGEAEKLHFLGSPTVQINGRDVEVARRADAASFSCRIYKTSAGNSGVPPKELIGAAILEAQCACRDS